MISKFTMENEGTGPMEHGRHLPYFDCCGTKPYWECTCDPRGALTIGYGTNLDVGISESEAVALSDSRLHEAMDDLINNFPWFTELSGIRQAALIDMRYQLGPAGFRGFKLMINALARKNYPEAKLHILSSKYAIEDAPSRARKVAYMIETNKSYQDGEFV